MNCVVIGAMIACGSPLPSGEVGCGGIILEVSGSEPSCGHADIVTNCTGLHAQEVAASLRGFARSQVPLIIYSKGNYFSLGGSARFKRLIYPVPQAAGLGVHLTIDLGGQVRFRPDVEGISSIDYSVDARRAWAHQPVRHRVPRPDRLAGDYSVCRRDDAMTHELRIRFPWVPH